MTCFIGVSLRITNGVGGGLNSMSAFSFLIALSKYDDGDDDDDDDCDEEWLG